MQSAKLLFWVKGIFRATAVLNRQRPYGRRMEVPPRRAWVSRLLPVLMCLPIAAFLSFLTRPRGGGFGFDWETMKPWWQRASAGFAEGAEGPVLRFQGLDPTEGDHLEHDRVNHPFCKGHSHLPDSLLGLCSKARGLTNRRSFPMRGSRSRGEGTGWYIRDRDGQ
jgi:hypothetical protein